MSPSSVVKHQSVLHRWLRPQRHRFRLAYVLAISQGILIIGQNILLARLFAYWLNGLPVWLTLKQTLPWLMLCWLISPFLAYIKENQLVAASSAIRSHLRAKLIHTLAILGPERRHFGEDGALSSLVLDQVDALDGYIMHYVVQQKMAVFMPLLIVFVTTFYSPLAAGLLFLTAPLVPLFMVLVGDAAARKNREQLSALARLSGRFLDLLRGLPTLRRLGALDQAQHTIDQAAKNYQWRTMNVLKLAFLSTAILELFSALAIALVAVYLGLGLIGVLPWSIGIIPVPYQGALLILLLAPEFYAPLRQLGADYHDKAKAEAASSAITALLEATPSQPTGTLRYQLTQAPAIKLDKVCMIANGRTRLTPTSFNIAPKERILLTGRSGSGKSSLLQALLGFAPFTGTITLNNIPYQQLNIPFVRQFIAYLAQTPPILPVSIAENLRLAQPQAIEQQLQQVLTQVGLWPLIAQLPQSLHTPLQERGLGLSGGQRQRLALAQMLLRDAPLWLLDEPTSHLDIETTQEIMQLLEKLSRGKTVILICHDETAVTWVDRIIPLSYTKDNQHETR